MDPDEISEEDFFEYEETRKEENANMKDLMTVAELTGLPGKTIKAITKHYEYLCDKFGGGA